MPQLDLTIVFSQIFWLFIFFFAIYTILTHFFLPKFLLSIKSRKKIITFNSFKVLETQKTLIKHQNALYNSLSESLVLVRNTLISNWTYISKPDPNSNLILVDEKISLTVFNTVKYCNFEVLNLISFYPRAFNFKLN